MRSIGVVTVARSDYGVYLPLLRAITSDAGLKLQLFVSGAHLTADFGSTVNAIEADGFPIAERVDMLLPSDAPEAVAESMGRGTAGFARAFARTRQDLLVILGDRFEMHAAAVAAVPFNIPMAHIGGGELTEGAIDDSFRHSLTKLSHLHFVYTEEFARRIVQMGEEPWRVRVCGALSLDNLSQVKLLDRSELEKRFALRSDGPFLLVTYHPVTLETGDLERQVSELLAALDASRMPVLFTMPNADTGTRAIRHAIEAYVRDHPQARAVENMGTQGYFSAMQLAAAMVGNSSSGILEAASFALPVVNVGTRQKGRPRAKNVLDVGYGRQEIAAAIQRAVSQQFRESLHGMLNPYGEGKAAPAIVSVLRSVPLDSALVRKRFADQRLGRMKATF